MEFQQLPIDIYICLSFFLGIYDFQNLFLYLKKYRSKKELSRIETMIKNEFSGIRSIEDKLLKSKDPEFSLNQLNEVIAYDPDLARRVSLTILKKKSPKFYLDLLFSSFFFANVFLSTKKKLHLIDYITLGIVHPELINKIKYRHHNIQSIIIHLKNNDAVFAAYLSEEDFNQISSDLRSDNYLYQKYIPDVKKCLQGYIGFLEYVNAEWGP